MTWPPFNLSNTKKSGFHPNQFPSAARCTNMWTTVPAREEEALIVLYKGSFLHSHLSFKGGKKRRHYYYFCNPATVSMQKQKHNRPTHTHTPNLSQHLSQTPDQGCRRGPSPARTESLWQQGAVLAQDVASSTQSAMMLSWNLAVNNNAHRNVAKKTRCRNWSHPWTQRAGAGQYWPIRGLLCNYQDLPSLARLKQEFVLASLLKHRHSWLQTGRKITLCHDGYCK